MSLLKKYQLNDHYWLEVCNKFDEGALNGEKFDVKNEWVIEEKLDEYKPIMYSTIAATRFNLKVGFYTATDAIQDIVAYAYTGQQKKLKDMSFKIVKQ